MDAPSEVRTNGPASSGSVAPGVRLLGHAWGHDTGFVGEHDLLAGHHRGGGHPGGRGPQVVGGCVHGHWDPPHRERRCAGRVGQGAGPPAKERNWELEAAQVEIGQLTEAVKAQATELAVIRGSPAGPERAAPGEGPRRSQGAGPQDRP